MLVPLSWETVKQFFMSEVPRLPWTARVPCRAPSSERAGI